MFWYNSNLSEINMFKMDSPGYNLYLSDCCLADSADTCHYIILFNYLHINTYSTGTLIMKHNWKRINSFKSVKHQVSSFKKYYQRCKVVCVQVVLSPCMFYTAFSQFILPGPKLCVCEKDPAWAVNP